MKPKIYSPSEFPPPSNSTWYQWQAHMERCIEAVQKPCRARGIEVTIVVRAPGAPAGLCQVSTNGNLRVARDAIANVLGTTNGGESAQDPSNR